MSVLPRNRTRTQALPTFLSGQRVRSQAFTGGQFSGALSKAKVAFQKIKTDVQTKRPGLLIPPKSTTSLSTPHGLSIDAVHQIPNTPVHQRLSIDVSR